MIDVYGDSGIPRRQFCLVFLEILRKKCLLVRIRKIFLSTLKMICPVKVKNLHQYSVAVALSHASGIIEEHSKNDKCYCFQCRIQRLLVETLLLKGTQTLPIFLVIIM